MTMASSDLDLKSECLDNHLRDLRRTIIAAAVASEGTSTEVPSEAAIWRSALRLAPGRPYPEKSSWFDRLSNGLANSTTLLASLTVIFAIMGLIGAGAISFGPKVASGTAQALTPFLDIAKIFAGAIVGSATTSAAIARSNRSN